MPSRTFTDARGVQWTVVDVAPAWAERRLKRDRRLPGRVPKPGQPERRTGDDRRRGLTDSGPRVKIDPRLATGWLAFDSAHERRRLAPVPEGWYEMSDAQLTQLVARASPIPHRRGRLIE